MNIFKKINKKHVFTVLIIGLIVVILIELNKTNKEHLKVVKKIKQQKDVEKEIIKEQVIAEKISQIIATEKTPDTYASNTYEHKTNYPDFNNKDIMNTAGFVGHIKNAYKYNGVNVDGKNVPIPGCLKNV